MNINRMHTAPVKWNRTRRNHAIATITSLQPGVSAPIAAIPLLREDGIGGRKSSNGKWSSSRIGVAIEMAETKEIIVNKVRARIMAYCVPFLAMERFNGSRDEFDRSYAGEESLSGDGVIPFIETHEMGTYGAMAVYKVLGLHAEPETDVNTMYLEAYNAIWNFRAKNRSQHLTPRARLDHSLAPAFWPHGRFEHIVPDFDEAVMDGQVALNVVAADMPVKVESFVGSDRTGQHYIAVVDGGGTTRHASHINAGSTASAWTTGMQANLFAELQADGITISLSNLEMAKKVQSFAKLREKFEGHSDDYIIDTFLMNGIEIPDQAYKQPFLIAEETVTFQQAKRYATDSGNLDDSAVSGVAYGNLTLRVPRINTGGVVMVLVEILPEQLWERQKDPFFHTTNHDAWPQALRDAADPEKVNIVTNGEIDTDHESPNGLFGYAPLNWMWNSFGARIGGKFHKPETSGGSVLERRRFWAHEPVNPGLTEDFYICQGLDTSIFLDEESDPFELVAQGNVVIDGNTQFGGVLVEATGNYDAIMAQMDQTRVKDEA